MFASKDIFLTPPSGGYTIARSVRVRSSASAYFNRTFSTPTSNYKFTFSAWIKRGSFSVDQTVLGVAAGTSGNTGSTPRGAISFDAGNTHSIFANDGGSTVMSLSSTPVYRDPSAWYHMVWSIDTTQVTSANRVFFYVNGVSQTLTGTFPNQNVNTIFNGTSSSKFHALGMYANLSSFIDLYFAEINFIDGQALTPSSFGTTNAITGVWQPAKYTGTYGTNGFYLNFSDNSAVTTSSNVGIGKDFSGNGNYWTSNSINVTAYSGTPPNNVNYDSMVDSPTVGATSSNYCVLNSLNQNSAITLSAGNLSFTASNNRFTTGTFAVTSGKWYWEFYPVAGGASGVGVGAILATTYVFGTAGFANGAGYTGVGYTSNGSKYISGTSSAYGATYGSGNVIGVALDLDSGTKTITFYKDNTSQGSINLPTSSEAWIVATDYSEAGTHSINFGQRPFSYTPPTGFVALNTYNLPASTITNGAAYMNAVARSGTGATATVAVGFQPDMIWSKCRSNAVDHNLFDSVRGFANDLFPNLTLDEDTTNVLAVTTSSTGYGFGSSNSINGSGRTYVDWVWKAGGTATTIAVDSISSGVPSIASTVSVGATQGFSVVTYSANGSTGTVGHGLGVAPSMIIVKKRNAAERWCVFHTSTSNAYIYLNETFAAETANAQLRFGNNSSVVQPTSTVFTIGSSNDVNGTSGTYVAYCFSAVAGYSAFGSYTGNGSADGPFVYTGFRPRFILGKASSGTNASTSNWFMMDSARNTYNVANLRLFANLSNPDNTQDILDFTSNGFKLRTNNTSENTSGTTYIYMAFAENPFKNALAR